MILRKLISKNCFCFSEKIDRTAIRDYLIAKKQDFESERSAMFFRSRRQWKKGCDLKQQSEIIRSSFSFPELNKGEILCSQAVIDCLLNFTEDEMIYFTHCLNLSIKKRKEVEKCKISLKTLDKIAGFFKRNISSRQRFQ